MKGQTFLIVAIIFIIILALIKASISFFQFKDESLFLEFENVKEEMIRSIEFSIHEKENLTKNLEAFATFSRNSFKRRSLEFKSFLLTAKLENSKLNLSIKNLLGSEILFLNLSVNDSLVEFKNIEDGKELSANFTIPEQNANYTLKIFYETPYSKESEEILLKVETKENKLLLFIDLRLENQKLKLRDKILKTYKLV